MAGSRAALRSTALALAAARWSAAGARTAVAPAAAPRPMAGLVWVGTRTPTPTAPLRRWGLAGMATEASPAAAQATSGGGRGAGGAGEGASSGGSSWASWVGPGRSCSPRHKKRGFKKRIDDVRLHDLPGPAPGPCCCRRARCAPSW